ncbi:epidermal growth factor receptor kinase substrate 8-like protein 3 isoform X2 [Sceloporus undulatus]|uniref:epidermal growth factor receptor kinase substrate 8-like protein 3 isoform X2 n=1 Tax=Sceloporus undulatus TaxID=8520 RepID=UPI001C4DD6AC|nr:epidermal growth factor receptor kinase substrate 8-like protein 3 isoform X2 [Sceloporus undulatus]
MADPFRHKEDVYYSETESSFKRANSMSRPSGKSIYRQRKEYTEAVIKQQHEFQHRVEHLLTCYIDSKEISSAENCIDRLKMMDAQGQVWGQDMFLQVTSQKLLLTDIEAEEELDSFPLEWIQDCTYFLDRCIYNSILAITVKELDLRRTSILLFQCEEIGAELLKTKLEKLIEDWRQNQDMHRSNLENVLHQRSQASFNGKVPGIPQEKRKGGLDHPTSLTEAPLQRQELHPWKTSSSFMDPNTEAKDPLGQQKQKDGRMWEDPGPPQVMQGIDENTAQDILNHVLDDIEIFVGKLEKASGSLNNNKKKKSKKKNQENKALPPKPEFEECFQKIKYSFNLLAKLEPVINQLSAPELAHLIFSTLSTILSNCPWTDLASTVVSPLLSPEGINLLRRSLNYDEQLIWKDLGAAWNLTRAEFPEGQSIPPYKPTFSDGWEPPMPTWRQHSIDLDKTHNGNKNGFSDRVSDPPQLMQAMYDFHARNSRELSVSKGDLLEVLDQRKKWWLARNSAGEEGYIPNNILEPTNQKAPSGNSKEQDSRNFPELQPSSSPAEVTVWLRRKGFSKITVKSLGILNGQQLLSMSQEELKIVCPEEGRRVFLMLSSS